MGSSREYWCPYCDKDASDHYFQGVHCKEERLYRIWTTLSRPTDPGVNGRYVAQFLPLLRNLIVDVTRDANSFLSVALEEELRDQIVGMLSLEETLVESDLCTIERLLKELRSAIRTRNKRHQIVRKVLNNMPYRGLDGTLEMLSEN